MKCYKAVCVLCVRVAYRLRELWGGKVEPICTSNQSVHTREIRYWQEQYSCGSSSFSFVGFLCWNHHLRHRQTLSDNIVYNFQCRHPIPED